MFSDSMSTGLPNIIYSIWKSNFHFRRIMASGSNNSITLDEPTETSELMQFVFKDVLKGWGNFIIRAWLLNVLPLLNNGNI